MPRKAGWKMTDEQKEKMRQAHLGKKRPPLTAEWKAKIGLAMRGNKYALGNKLTPEQRAKVSAAMKGKRHADHSLTVRRILAECVELEKQGFRAVPVGWKIIPDIIAIKDGKVYAVEVEYGKKPNYGKYTGEVQAYYDDVILILRKPDTKESA